MHSMHKEYNIYLIFLAVIIILETPCFVSHLHTIVVYIKCIALKNAELLYFIGIQNASIECLLGQSSALETNL